MNRTVLHLLTVSLSALLIAPLCGLAQEQSPYAGEDQRTIKSLSRKEIRSLRAGAGMGFAKLAELNHYPGPKHVMAIAGDLQLSPEQLLATEALYEEMHVQAVELGERLIDAERQLDNRFRDATISEEALNRALMTIGELRARLRYVHLEAHLRQKRLLTHDQVRKYDEIRGYRP